MQRRWLLPLVFACVAAGSARPEIDFKLRSIGKEVDNVTVTAVFTVRGPDGKEYLVKCLPGDYINGTGGWMLKDIRDPKDGTFHQ